MKKLYLEITKDEYALPLAVAESPIELSKMVGTSKQYISSVIHKHQAGEIKRPRFIAVEVPDE